MKWECICITLEDYQEYLTSIRKSRDQNEKNLYKRIEEEIIPELARVAEDQARKEARKMKELETLQKLANAKRSSRISARLEKQKEVDHAEETERRRKTELAMAKAEQEKQRKIEEVCQNVRTLLFSINLAQAHESRRQTREQRIREREAAKILQEENLRKLQEDEEKLVSEEARLSERHLKAQMRKAKKELEKLKEKEYWLFDCEKCGLNGECIVSIISSFSSVYLTDALRMMANHKYSVMKRTAVAFGNTRPVTIYRRSEPRRRTSSSCVLPADEEGKPQQNLNLRSNLG